jgi:hypothetical protein
VCSSDLVLALDGLLDEEWLIRLQRFDRQFRGGRIDRSVEFGGSGGRTSGPLAKEIAAVLLDALGPDLDVHSATRRAMP